jgi:hypothetical protein
MAAPQEVLDLVARFEENLAAYASGAYNEAQLRREFIDPLFRTLGWDLDNVAGHAEAYKDVIHEDAIRIGGAVKAPDYCFRIGGTRKFFVEAKKPAVRIAEEAAPVYQLRRYAWSAGLPLSILTNFEEFAVYDCRIKPDQNDRPATARILFFSFRDYAARWEEIAAVFTKEAVLRGAFDHYAESTRLKKGTAGVDAAFLREIESWRDLLARTIALRNPALTQRELNTAVTLTINRIIFLRICEDRGIEPYGQFQGLLNGNGVYKRLIEIFQRADDRYNSGLFHFQQEQGRTAPPDRLTLDLAIDDKALKEIFQGLYYPDSPYEFSVLPADILGRVYEQFLGKVIRLTAGHQAKVEDKPEVKKAGGVFYTPKYIVDYIVKETIGRLLEGRPPAQADRLRILDPACGSGSFLIQAYQRLLDGYRDRYVAGGPEKRTKGRRPVLYQAAGGEWRLTTAERKRILLNSIYGVDIDPQAVEVTKLSLLLKVLEGESGETLTNQIKLFQERALPDLSANIRCGNSLIGQDFYDGELPNLLDEEDRYRINVFDWAQEFPEVFTAGGFDAVVGNPPYVRQEMLGDFKDYFQKYYQVYDGVADLYTYFIEKGVALLRSDGYFSYIVANKWLRAGYGRPLRNWMNGQGIEEIVDFGDLPVFTGATTYTCIIRIRKGNPSDTFGVVKADTLQFDSLAVYAQEHRYEVRRESLEGGGWSLSDEGTAALLKKLRQTGIPLKEYVKGRIYYGIKTGFNEAFVIDAATRERLIAEDPKSAELIKRFLAGRDIKRYEPPTSDHFLIFTRRGIDIKRYPTIESHLKRFKERLLPKPKDWKGADWKGRKPGAYLWYEIQDAVDYYAEFEKPKILWPGISAEVAAFTFDESGFYGNDNNQIIITDDRYLLGILNSSLVKLALINVCDKVQGGFYRLKIAYISQIPIRIIDFADAADRERHDRMVDLVEEMLALHRQLAVARTDHEQTNLKRQIDATDSRINRLVYDLYNLTDDEIRIVEKD